MWICPKCQKENEGNCCTVCGMPFERIQNPPMGQFTPVQHVQPGYPGAVGGQEKKNRGLLITCCVLSGIGILLVILLLVLILGKDDFQATGLQTISQTEAPAVQTAQPVVTATPAPMAEAVISSAPATNSYWFERDREGFLAYVRRQLGIPENLKATATIGDVTVWEAAGDALIVHVSFECENGVSAGASVDPYTGELARSILAYVPPENETVSDYQSYHNSRYGYSIEYPSFLTNAQYGQNGAGALFSNSDESVMLYVDGDHMAEFGTTPSLSELKAEYKERAAYGVHYETMKDNWFVLSGEAGDTVYYEKHFLKSDGTHNQFVILYPKSREKEFDSIVKYILQSFTTGVGADSAASR